MEWIEGCRVNDQTALLQASIRPQDVAVLLLDAFAEMTYVHGFVHGDPHPGNILVRPAPHQGQAAHSCTHHSFVCLVSVHHSLLHLLTACQVPKALNTTLPRSPTHSSASFMHSVSTGREPIVGSRASSLFATRVLPFPDICRYCWHICVANRHAGRHETVLMFVWWLI